MKKISFMSYGLDKKTIDKICGVFKNFKQIEKAVLYGSRAKGNYKKGSDIDLTLFGDELNLDIQNEIAESLDDLLLPYTIDLSIFAELNHDKLKDHIKRIGITFYEKKKNNKQGWEIKKLGDVCEIDKKQGIHNNLPYVGLEHIESNTCKFIGSTEPLLVKSSTFKFSNEHILYGRLRPYLNKVLLPDFCGHCSTEIFPIKPKPFLLKRFLQYWFIGDKTVNKINETCTGARMPRANMHQVLKFKFLLPPLSEQKEIVAKLDTAFEEIAKAKENAEANLKNTKELFESYLNNIFSSKGKNWEIKKLGDVCEKIFAGGDKPDNYSKEKTKECLIPIYSNGIKNDGLYGYTDYPTVNKKAVTVSARGTIGFVCIRKEPFTPIVRLIVAIPNKETDISYLAYSIKNLIPEGNGTSIPQLTVPNFKKNKIPIPPLSEQKEIVAKLDELSQETKHMEEIYKQKLTALEELKQSILNQAFNGGL